MAKQSSKKSKQQLVNNQVQSSKSAKKKNNVISKQEALEKIPNVLFWSVLICIAIMYLVTQMGTNNNQENPYQQQYAEAESSTDNDANSTLQVYSDTYIMDADMWVPDTVDKTTIKNIVISRGFPPADTQKNNQSTEVDNAEPSSTIAWDASENQQGGITCYIDGEVLYIYSHGADRILLSYDASRMFSGFTNLENIQGLDILDPKETGRMEWMFADCHNLKELRVPGSWDTSSVTDMSYMFFNCYALEHLYLDKLDANSVTTMDYMFAYCKALKELSMQGWTLETVAAVESRTQMFMNVGETAGAIILQLSSSDLTAWVQGDSKNALENTMWPKFGTILTPESLQNK